MGLQRHTLRLARGLQAKGFTLLEVLVALLVFAVMSVMAYGGLRSVLQASESTGATMDRLAELQRVFLAMGRDVEQLVGRQIRDEYGESQPAVRGGGGESLLELTRAGWPNPARQARSTLQRVVFRFDENTIYRLHWAVLDRAQDSEARETRLLDDVAELRVRFLDQALEWHDEWPPLGPQQATLRAIEIVLALEDGGEFRRLFAVIGE